MSDTDEIRAAVRDATRLPGSVLARAGAAATIRARARRRRTLRVASAVLVPLCLVLAAVLAGAGGLGPQRATVPASVPSPSAAPTAATPSPSLAPGPRTLIEPIEIRPVLEEYLECPSDRDTVPAEDGSGCYRLAAAALVIENVQDLAAGLRTGPDGLVTEGTALRVTMTAADSKAFAALTSLSVGKQVALVVDGTVYSAPMIATPITAGQIEIDLGNASAEALVAALVE